MPEAFQQDQKTALEPIPQSHPKMLIADDDPAIVRVLADRCAKMGFNVETATNGMQLLIKARRSQPDIMIVDVNMPEMDGLSVCSRMLDPGSNPVEIVVITGSSNPETEERCDSLGLFYGRKGPDFWKNIETALTEIYPHMAQGALPLIEMGHEIHQRPRVLVVDDDPAIQQFFTSRLDKYSIDTLYAPNATLGFRIAGKEQPSVIIADNFMPNGDAQYLLHRLRSSPATENIPVFVISGRDLDEVTEQTLRRDIGRHAGAARVFRKSFDTEELFNALKKFCAFETKLS